MARREEITLYGRFRSRGRSTFGHRTGTQDTLHNPPSRAECKGVLGDDTGPRTRAVSRGRVARLAICPADPDISERRLPNAGLSRIERKRSRTFEQALSAPQYSTRGCDNARPMASRQSATIHATLLCTEFGARFMDTSRLVACTFAVVFALGGCGTVARAQTPPNRDFATYRPTVKATRIDPSQAPVIDGDLSDPIWSKAQVIDEFYQSDPDEGAPGSQRTTVRILYDEDNLYIAVMAYDNQPDRILGRIKQRDGSLDSDDLIRIYLDPNMTRRNGYVFDVNPLGARRDGLLQNNSSILFEWNTLWSAKARILANGWSVEMAIPFRSLSYDSHADWGLEIGRAVRRRNELIRWATVNKTISSNDISREGTLTGITESAKDWGSTCRPSP